MTPRLDRILSFVLLLGCLTGYAREGGEGAHSFGSVRSPKNNQYL